MFAKNYHLYWITARANILCKNLKFIYFQFCAWLFRFLFYVISRSNCFLWSRAIWKTRHRHLGVGIQWTLSFIQYKSPLESKISSIYFSQWVQQPTLRSLLMKCHEMSHDNTVFNFTETEHCTLISEIS